MVYMSLRENLFPPWSLNCVGQLSVQVYSDAHHQNVSVSFTQKQNALEFLVIPLLEKTCLWAILYFR